MEWISDPTVWVGLLTLVLLEVVLGVDNLIFIAILSDKLPPEQRDRARIIGLSLALLMRLGLLASITWVMSLTTPLLSFWRLEISWRDLILIAGGVFLLIKATTEIHDRVEGGHEARVDGGTPRAVLADRRADRGARRGVLARLGDHRGRHGGRALRDDGGGHHRGGGDAVRVQAAHRVHQQAALAHHPVPGLPADDRPGAGGRRPRPAHPERLCLRRDRLLGADRDPQPAHRRAAAASAPPACARASRSPRRSCDCSAAFRFPPRPCRRARCSPRPSARWSAASSPCASARSAR